LDGFPVSIQTVKCGIKALRIGGRINPETDVPGTLGLA
jgi:hypothetical protein